MRWERCHLIIVVESKEASRKITFDMFIRRNLDRDPSYDKLSLKIVILHIYIYRLKCLIQNDDYIIHLYMRPFDPDINIVIGVQKKKLRLKKKRKKKN